MMEKATIPGPGNGAGKSVDGPRMPPASGPNTGGEHERHLDPRTMEQGVTTIPETDAAADGFPEGGREAEVAVSFVCRQCLTRLFLGLTWLDSIPYFTYLHRTAAPGRM